MGANRRVAKLRSDLALEESLAEGAYWFQPRGMRTDAAPPELLELMKRFWHTNDTSLGSINPRNIDMWRPWKREGDKPHARRQLHVQGGGQTAFSKFCEWLDYIHFKRIRKSEKGENINDPRCTLFFFTRYKCLTIPKTDQCAFKYPHAARLVPEGAARNGLAGSCSMRLSVFQGLGRANGFEGDVGSLGDFSGSLRMPKSEPARGEPGG